ncbi:hypothetical protein [Rhodospirillum centenum]|nr:hypothetical protein [Rhodospirillum centenum]
MWPWDRGSHDYLSAALMLARCAADGDPDRFGRSLAVADYPPTLVPRPDGFGRVPVSLTG